MASLPDADPAPADGGLPASVADGAADRALGAYVHVPFCVRRCGYCDFNTYTPGELGAAQNDLSAAYLSAVHREIDLAATVLDEAELPRRPLSTVFFGGGTPTMLPPEALIGVLARLGASFGLTDDVEVTTEANPDSVTPASLQALAAGGITRVSFGMQSAVTAVLATLDRTHDPARVAAAVGWARSAGLSVSLDLIYGTPGESLEQWRQSLDAVIALRPDHVSAYSLTIEPGTAMAARVRRGQLAGTDQDDLAAKYELADDLLGAAGYHWYEISNWALGGTHEESRANRCRHNLGYWQGDDWWGFGPGAHSHVGGVRWWNVKHPRRYAHLLDNGGSPAQAREVLDEQARRLERIMLAVRLRDGYSWHDPSRGPSDAKTARTVDALVSDGLVVQRDPLVLSRRGRLLADHVVRELAF
ncbi:MAG: radical SAM family heme chaperone HemW [Actinomycetales bacterium]